MRRYTVEALPHTYVHRYMYTYIRCVSEIFYVDLANRRSAFSRRLTSDATNMCICYMHVRLHVHVCTVHAYTVRIYLFHTNVQLPIHICCVCYVTDGGL